MTFGENGKYSRLVKNQQLTMFMDSTMETDDVEIRSGTGTDFHENFIKEICDNVNPTIGCDSLTSVTKAETLLNEVTKNEIHYDADLKFKLKTDDNEPQSDTGTDFHEILKKEICDEVNQRIGCDGLVVTTVAESYKKTKKGIYCDVYDQCKLITDGAKPWSDTHTDFHEILKKEICDDINPKKGNDSLATTNEEASFLHRVTKNEMHNDVDDNIQLKTECLEMQKVHKIKNTSDEPSLHATEIPYKCDISSSEFSTSSNLTRHKRTHSKEKPYKCDICSSAYSSKYNLIIHIRKHTGEKPYKCDFCSSAFVSNFILTIHKRTHIGEKPYKCDICSSAFASNPSLTLHKRRHSLYKCDICSATFTGRFNLTLHKRTHEKPYKCDICSSAFALNFYLILHKRTHTE